jgi:hypothetical protein
MFKLSKDEYDSLRYQFGTLKRGRHSKYLPYAFTEQGVAMLSSVLNSTQAIQVNIQIMRTFIKFRKIMDTHADLSQKIKSLEKAHGHRFEQLEAEIQSIFDAIKMLVDDKKSAPRKPIGFGR